VTTYEIHRAGVVTVIARPPWNGVVLIYIIPGSIICNVTFGYTERCAGQFSNNLVVIPFHKCARSYDLHVPGARRLGAGAPLTVLRFAPGAGFSHYLLHVCQVH
jgi:hypothetical protein